jgi:hypothetical protein
MGVGLYLPAALLILNILTKNETDLDILAPLFWSSKPGTLGDHDFPRLPTVRRE